MNDFKLLLKFIIFMFGFFVGGFLTVTIIREMVPLKDHFYLIIIYTIYFLPILAGLLFWYFKIIKLCGKFLGEEKGDFIGAVITFILVVEIIIFILVIGVFYTAIA